jgi:hypothetical protein
MAPAACDGANVFITQFSEIHQYSSIPASGTSKGMAAMADRKCKSLFTQHPSWITASASACSPG